MYKLLEVTNIKNEPTESCRFEIPNELKIKEESDCLPPSEIYIKTEPQDDDNESQVTTSICCVMYPESNTDEQMVKIEYDNPFIETMQDPLDVESKIKVKLEGKKEHYSSDLEDELENKMEKYEEECNSPKNEESLIKKKRIYKNHNLACHLCGKLFPLQCYLNRHLRSHAGEKPFKCQICEKSFSVKGNLNTHMLIHSGEKTHECDVCKKFFRLKSVLVKHKMIHGSEKPFSCSECNRSFKLKHTLKRHYKRAHTGDKLHSCDQCDKSFTNKSKLARHKRIHTQVKSYSCDICHISFTQKSQLKAHVDINHKSEIKFSPISD